MHAHAHEMRTQQQLYLEQQWRDRTMFRDDEDSINNNKNNNGEVTSTDKPAADATKPTASSTNDSTNASHKASANAMVVDIQPALAYCLQRSLHTWLWVVPLLTLLSWMVGYDVTFVAGAFETSACCFVIVLQVSFWLLLASNAMTTGTSKASTSTKEYREVSGLLAACVFFVVFGNVAMGFWARSSVDLSA